MTKDEVDDLDSRVEEPEHVVASDKEPKRLRIVTLETSKGWTATLVFSRRRKSPFPARGLVVREAETEEDAIHELMMKVITLSTAERVTQQAVVLPPKSGRETKQAKINSMMQELEKLIHEEMEGEKFPERRDHVLVANLSEALSKIGWVYYRLVKR